MIGWAGTVVFGEVVGFARAWDFALAVALGEARSEVPGRRALVGGFALYGLC